MRARPRTPTPCPDAPWCFWSNKLQPAWNDVAKRLHARAYSQSVKFIKIDCTTASGGALCKQQSIHAFPSVRIYRGSSHAFEPYEFGREANVMWLHLVKTAAELLVNEMTEARALVSIPRTSGLLLALMLALLLANRIFRI